MKHTNCVICGRDISPYQRKTLYCNKCYKLAVNWGESVAKRLLDKARLFTREEAAEMGLSHNPPYDINNNAHRAIILRTIRHTGCSCDFRRFVVCSWSIFCHVEGNKAKMYKVDRCAACGAQENLEAHHILPLSWGGETVAENINTLCAPCHKREHKRLNSILTGRFRREIMKAHGDEISSRLTQNMI